MAHSGRRLAEHAGGEAAFGQTSGNFVAGGSLGGTAQKAAIRTVYQRVAAFEHSKGVHGVQVMGGAFQAARQVGRYLPGFGG